MKTVVCVLLSALVLAGTAAAGATRPEWTRKDAQAAVRALRVPKPHPKKIACHGLGTATKGIYASFRCKNTYRRGHKRFTISSDSTGWVTVNGRLLRKGFVSAGELARIGGFSQSAPDAAGAYALRKYGTVGGFNCTNTSGTQWSCVFSTPAVTVTITYTHAKGGWLLTGAG